MVQLRGLKNGLSMELPAASKRTIRKTLSTQALGDWEVQRPCPNHLLRNPFTTPLGLFYDLGGHRGCTLTPKCVWN